MYCRKLALILSSSICVRYAVTNHLYYDVTNHLYYDVTNHLYYDVTNH